jgi:hypothetical protein
VKQSTARTIQAYNEAKAELTYITDRLQFIQSEIASKMKVQDKLKSDRVKSLRRPQFEGFRDHHRDSSDQLSLPASISSRKGGEVDAALCSQEEPGEDESSQLSVTSGVNNRLQMGAGDAYGTVCLPAVQDMISERRAMYEMQEAIRSYQRKIDILELAEKNRRRLVKRAESAESGLRRGKLLRGVLRR